MKIRVQAILRSKVRINGTSIRQTVCLFPESHERALCRHYCYSCPQAPAHLSVYLFFLHAKGHRGTLRGERNDRSLINTATLLLLLYWYLGIPNGSLCFLPSFLSKTGAGHNSCTHSTCIRFSRKNRTSMSQGSRVASQALKSFSHRSLCRSPT